jgi:hypothetical protein
MMRDYTTLSAAGTPACTPIPACPSSVRAQTVYPVDKAITQMNYSRVQRSSFSQRSRQSVMKDNFRDAFAFMDQQAKVIKSLIKQFQIFTGYREQLPRDFSSSQYPDAWSVYLMHAQAVQESMTSCFRGKALFGNGAQPPVRMHLEVKGKVQPFDLPDPTLLSMVSVRAFLSGVSDHRLPSVEVGNACMAELLNALVEIQQGKESLSRVASNLENNRGVSRRTIQEHAVPPQPITWISKLINSVRSQFSLPNRKPFFA